MDFLAKDFVKNPYKTYNSMRKHKPILFSQTTRLHWVTKMEFAQEMLRDKRFSVDDRKYPIAEQRRKEFKKAGREIMLEQFENPSMLKLDPPDHSRIRKLVQYGFTNRYITSLEPEIKKVVDDCLDKVHNQDSFDLIEDLAKPLPAIVIAKMMGLPNEDLDQFQAWSEDLLVGVGGIGTSKEDIKKSGDAYEALIRYFEKVIITRKDAPGDDFIGKLIAAEEEGEEPRKIKVLAQPVQVAARALQRVARRDLGLEAIHCREAHVAPFAAVDVLEVLHTTTAQHCIETGKNVLRDV